MAEMVSRIIMPAVVALLWPAWTAIAQEMEPRAYSPAPVGTNFAGFAYAYSSGDVLLDPTLPLTNVEAKIHNFGPAYSRTFDFFGRLGSFGGFVPIVHGDVQGDVGEQTRETSRTGLADIRLRFATNLVGGTALNREEFLTKRPTTVFGTSLSVVVPSGEYNSEKLINIGSNRWAFKPDIGWSHLMGNWFLETSAGAWLFTDNPNFYGGVRRSQDPLATFQVHGGYNFSPGLWLAGNAVYYTGGKTTVAGVENDDLQANSRYGLTLSLPLAPSYSLKLAWSEGLTARSGGDFTTVSAALQYRWFDN